MSTKDLIDAIASNDSLAIETSFNATMADKISVKLDAMRQSVAQNMFKENQVEVSEEIEFTQEEWDALSEEEKAEYEVIEEAQDLKGAQKTLKKTYGAAHDTSGQFDTERKDQAAAKRQFVKAKKVIKKSGGNATYQKTKAQAVKKFERENSYY